jgi:DNA-binding NarL/FixJ family response regulator
MWCGSPGGRNNQQHRRRLLIIDQEAPKSGPWIKGGPVRIFIVFRDTIYASGLAATLTCAPGVQSVEGASSIALAWEHEAFPEADVVVLDSDLGGALAFVREVALQGGARVLLCLREATTFIVLEAVGNGVGGAVVRDRLTPDALLAAVSAVASGLFTLDTQVVRTLSESVAKVGEAERTDGMGAGVAPREQMVLSLVAAGLSNREIAQRLSYSERTIKTILHDVAIKLGVKSRSQAVALAVRERII